MHNIIFLPKMLLCSNKLYNNRELDKVLKDWGTIEYVKLCTTFEIKGFYEEIYIMS